MKKLQTAISESSLTRDYIIKIHIYGCSNDVNNDDNDKLKKK